MKQEMIGDVPNSILGMYADLSHKLQAGAITPEELGLFLKKRNPFAVNSEKLLDQWHQFYLDIFDIGATFSGIRIPNFRESFPWLIVPIPEVPTNAVWQGYKNQGIPTWSYYGDDLEAVITQNDRNTKKGAYVIWVRDRVEADEELKNLSANQLKDKNIPVITCDERLRLGLYYWWKTGGKKGGKHLDIQNITLCPSSRDTDGSVPGVSFGCSEVNIDWYNPDFAFDNLRTREVVS